MTQPKPSPPLRLVNPHPPSTNIDATKVTALIINSRWRYFFSGVLAGHRGSQQILIATFFEKLYHECQSRGISHVWDPDSEQRIAELLADLNFRKPEPAAAPSVDSRAPSRRRATPGPPKRKGKSAASDSDTAGA